MDTTWALIITAILIGLSSLFGDKQEIKDDKDNTNILPPELYKREKGKCCFCNEKVSRREFYHQNCMDIYLDGKSRLLGLSSSLLSDEMNIDNFDNVIEDIKANNYIKDEEIKPLLIELFDKTIDIALCNDIISEITEENILLYINHFKLDPNTDVAKAWEKACKGVTIRKVTQGILPQQMNIRDELPFNIQKDEKIVWCFKDVKECQYKTKTEYQGGSIGYSFRVAKGVYIRQSAFKGHPVNYTSLETLDRGIVLLTDKNLYFGGDYNIFKLPFDKILAIRPYDDAVVIQKDASNAKPIVFMLNDVWFFYNLIYNLTHIEF